MALARSRGASGAQVLLPTLVEGLLVAVPPAALATVAAVLLVDGGRAWPSVAMAAAVVAIAVAILVGTVVPTARGLGPERRHGEGSVGRVGGRRLVVEALVVALAVGAAYLLSERGVGGPGPGVGGGESPTVVPLPAASIRSSPRCPRWSGSPPGSSPCASTRW